MAEVDPTMGADSKEAKSRLEDIKYYTSLFLGTLCIVCVFGFLFLGRKLLTCSHGQHLSQRADPAPDWSFTLV